MEAVAEKVTYISSPKHRGMKIVYPKRGVIASFEKSENCGICTVDGDDLETIRLLEEHPEFGKSFARVEGSKLPQFSRSNINHGVITSRGEPSEVSVDEIKSRIRKELAKKFERLNLLSDKVLRKGTTDLKENASPALVKEYEELKKELTNG